MEVQWIADRATLRRLLHTEPSWSVRDYAEALGRSAGWVKKWRQRLRAAPPDDEQVLRSRSRARHHPPPRITLAVVERILSFRNDPPAHLQRIPGPRTIRYFLEHDPTLQGERLPRSTRTIWQILTRADCIAHSSPRSHTAVERPAPFTAWQLDFKDASTVPPDPEGKQQHVVEVLNIVDTGTSILVSSQARADFTAETAIRALVPVLQEHGVPHQITFDRDSRFVGGGGHRDVPAAFLRFWLCLGAHVTVCPPHRPDRNGFVERLHRTLTEECLQIFRPSTLAEVEQVTATFQQHYNTERPNQAITCQNQPPRVAFPTLPPLPALPPLVDPDRWITVLDGQRYVRKVRRDTSVTVDEHPYYVSQALVGQYVTLRIAAAERAFVIEYGDQVIKQVPIKGLGSGPIPIERFVEQLCAEARTERQTSYRGMRQQSFVF